MKEEHKHLEDAYVIDLGLRDNESNNTVISEFGSMYPVRFLDEDQVSAYDSEGNKINIPKCEKCGCSKSQVIGTTHSAWVCINECREGI